MKLLLETKEEEKLIRKQSVDIRELYGICVKNNNSINPNIEVLVDVNFVDFDDLISESSDDVKEDN